MTPPAPGPGLGLVGEAADLRALGPRRPPGPRPLPRSAGRGPDSTVEPSTTKQRLEGHLVALGRAEQLDGQRLALLDTLLLATGPDHRIHKGKSIPERNLRPRRQRAPGALLSDIL